MVRASIVVLLVLGVTAVTLAADPLDFSAEGMSFAAVPTERARGGDDVLDEQGLHMTGEDCGICHTPGGRAGTHVFSMAGTLYEDRLGTRPLVGAEVVLQDVAGNVISMTTNAAGNFWTYAPIASNPMTVASHSGITDELYHYDSAGALVPADPEDSRTWQYKAWIRNGDQVIAMTTIAPVGGATGPTPRMSCNMHHSPTGSTGAAWVSRLPSLTSYPERGLSFRQHIQPILASKCAPCHTPGNRTTRLVTASDVAPTDPTIVDYSGGHDFTSYAGSTVTVGSGATSRTFAKEGVADVVDTSYPDMSPILVRTLIRDPESPRIHPGGGFWREGDPDYRAIRQWIVEGAQDN